MGFFYVIYFFMVKRKIVLVKFFEIDEYDYLYECGYVFFFMLFFLYMWFVGSNIKNVMFYINMIILYNSFFCIYIYNCFIFKIVVIF